MTGGLLTSPEGVAQVQAALEEQDLDGWFLFEFRHQNPVSAALLGIGPTTRRSFVLVPRDGEPVALTHAIERSPWRDWPWEIRSYAGWVSMEEGVQRLLAGRRRVALETSERSGVPTLDVVPAGVVQLVQDAGATPVTSGNLVTRFYSVWTAEQLERHRHHAEIIKDVAAGAFSRAQEAIRAGSPTTEGALGGWILDTLAQRGITGERDCHVAVGAMAADPHYAPSGAGKPITAGEALLIDLWGKETADDVWADQTWMGYLGSALPERLGRVWSVVREARDRAIAFIGEEHGAGRPVRGLEVDDVARAVIGDAGFGDAFIHRTGHSIDRAIHGRGPNLDNLETRDDRILLEGVGFSVEPGVYLPGELGVRSEVNVHLGRGGPEVTPREPQTEVLLLPVA